MRANQLQCGVTAEFRPPLCFLGTRGFPPSRVLTRQLLHMGRQPRREERAPSQRERATAEEIEQVQQEQQASEEKNQARKEKNQEECARARADRLQTENEKLKEQLAARPAPRGKLSRSLQQLFTPRSSPMSSTSTTTTTW